MKPITGSTSIAAILKICPSARRIFDEHGLHGCGGGNGPAESLEFFASVHEADLDSLLRHLNAEMNDPRQGPHTYQESLADYIYRRFFKAGIVIMLTLGGLWGVIALFEISFHRELLQPQLLPFIHAHGHAMIFGWVGLFVMGFAYQSFPRFKVTTLWRPHLANLTLYLMLGGILVRAAGDMLEHGAAAMALGSVSVVAEVAAIGLFILIIYKTSSQSISPRNPYEGLMMASLAWFLVQAVFSGIFFFAQATAATPGQLIFRVALLDGPLRDMQLFGFAGLIIAGVSQRFVPVVYGLEKPKHDYLRAIFWLINGSLVLDIASYLAFFMTGNRLAAFFLEISYFLMPLWAVLLVVQLGIFRCPTQFDRCWKFIRAAYVWLLIAMAMMPLLVPYSNWTGGTLSHAFWGAERHAFTVGFVSMMILAVSSRVVPILAGVDSKQLSSLWGPFILLNTGCAGRVSLQVLTDFVPHFAYSVIGITGIMELSAIAWWGVGLWQVMNLSKTRWTSLLKAPSPLGVR